MATAVKKRSRGLGVSLKRHGNLERGAFVVTFRDPRHWQNPLDPTKGRKVVRRSLKTRERGFAEKCKAALDQIIQDRSLWGTPPEDCPAVVREIWLGAAEDVEVGHGDATYRVAPAPEVERDFTLELDLEKLDPTGHGLTFRVGQGRKLGEEHIHKTVGDYKDADKALSFAIAHRLALKELAEVRKASEATQAELEALKTENKALRHKLRLYSKRAEKAAKVGTLQEELDKYLAHNDQRKVTHKRKGILRSTLTRFVEDVGPNRRADDLTEADVSQYVEAYRQRDDRPIGEERRKEIRAHVCTFLETATHHTFTRRAVKRISSHAVARERKPIVWLEEAEAQRLIKEMYALHGNYWGDAALVQLRMGWRPSELTLLQTEHSSKDSIHLVAVVDPETGVVSAKTGQRSLPVPKAAQPAVKRRLREAVGGLLFPAIRHAKGRGKEKGRKSRRTGLLASAWSEDHFFKQFTSKLREAAAKAGINKPVDGRTLRRTFGSLLLRDGRNKRTVAEVAAAMGNQPKVVARHYARIEASEIDLNLAAKRRKQPKKKGDASGKTKQRNS